MDKDDWIKFLIILIIPVLLVSFLAWVVNNEIQREADVYVFDDGDEIYPLVTPFLVRPNTTIHQVKELGDLSLEHNVDQFPTVVILVGGKEEKRLHGKEEISEHMEKWIARRAEQTRNRRSPVFVPFPIIVR